jgi:integrase
MSPWAKAPWIFRRYYAEYRPEGEYLFPGRKPGTHLCTGAVSQAMKKVVKAAGINKKASHAHPPAQLRNPPIGDRS